MESLKTAIRRNLKDAGRVAVLAIGSSLRGDDAAGLEVADQLRRIRTKARSKTAPTARRSIRNPQSAIRIFLGETAPENLTGEIKKFRPTHLVILDAADAGRKRPGSITLIQHDLLRGGSSISTHNMPVNILVQYLQQSVPVQSPDPRHPAEIARIRPAALRPGEESRPASRRRPRRITERVTSSFSALGNPAQDWQTAERSLDGSDLSRQNATFVAGLGGSSITSAGDGRGEKSMDTSGDSLPLPAGRRATCSGQANPDSSRHGRKLDDAAWQKVAPLPLKEYQGRTLRQTPPRSGWRMTTTACTSPSTASRAGWISSRPVTSMRKSGAAPSIPMTA